MSDDDDDINQIIGEEVDDLQIIQDPEDIETFQEAEDVDEQNDAANENAEGDTSEKTDVKTKRILNPQPKLNADRLKGPRGIHTLETIFSKIKFNGKGHEEEDLNVLMRGYEYWCHRLFPKFRFDDCLERIERLGSKKEVQTHIKKIRMNLLFLDDINGTVPNEEADAAENLLNSNSDDPFELVAVTTQESTTVNEKSQMASNESPLSEDQLERMRINRERAKRIRQQKLISSSFSTNDDSRNNDLPESQDAVRDQISEAPVHSVGENSIEPEEMQVVEVNNKVQEPAVETNTDISFPSTSFKNMDNQIHFEKAMDIDDPVVPDSIDASISQIHSPPDDTINN